MELMPFRRVDSGPSSGKCCTGCDVREVEEVFDVFEVVDVVDWADTLRLVDVTLPGMLVLW